MSKRANSGFSLIEVLVALVLTGGGTAALVGALSNLNLAEAHNLEAERMQTLAVEKLNEIVAVQDFNTDSGDFLDRGESNYTWTMTDELTSVANLENIQVTVTKSDQPDKERSVRTLIYRAPTETGGNQ